ncbi:MAG: Uncharacterised protein [Flavobacteriales bacterium UBA4585]|nr:MAG: Uncharacterised protein [Flavobacteriales bacterium UBA4585]
MMPVTLQVLDGDHRVSKSLVLQKVYQSVTSTDIKRMESSRTWMMYLVTRAAMAIHYSQWHKQVTSAL